MSNEPELNELIHELSSIELIDERRLVIFNDVQSDSPKYKVLAETDPYKLFELLDGDNDDMELFNWAPDYSYEDHVEQLDLEYDSEEAAAWDLEERSIEYAHDVGFWLVTGISIVYGPKGIELPFEFEFNEGYQGPIIGTPYNQSEHGGHGFLF
jgi:hypothetical protein